MTEKDRLIKKLDKIEEDMSSLRDQKINTKNKLKKILSPFSAGDKIINKINKEIFIFDRVDSINRDEVWSFYLKKIKKNGKPYKKEIYMFSIENYESYKESKC